MNAADSPRPIAAPPHPDRRREPLPWHRPKHHSEDPAARQKVEAILRSATYRRLQEDPDFLEADESRGVRLQLDYMKPQVQLHRHEIVNTVVVFGGTRLREPAAARQRLEDLQQQVRQAPSNQSLQAQLSRAKRVFAKSRYYEEARAFGRLVAESGDGPGDHRLVVMTGGGPGAMEAANRGAEEAGAKTIGLNVDLPHEQFPNPYVTPELCFRFHYFAIRKLHFLLRARALVAFPGGLGTLDEIFETLTLIQTRKIAPIPVVLVGEQYWRRAIDLDFVAEEGMIDTEDQDLFWFTETAHDTWIGIQSWYSASGRSLLD